MTHPPVATDPQRSLDYILSMVKRFVRADHATCEDIAFDVWLLCFRKHYAPTPQIIHNVATDWLRHQRIVREEDRLLAIAQTRSRSPNHDNIQFIHELLERTDLSERERQAIWLAFWCEDMRLVNRNDLKTGLFKLLVAAQRSDSSE